MESLITKRPSGNSTQRRRAWRKFKIKYEALGYEVKRKKDFMLKGQHVCCMFIAKIKL